MNISRKDDSTKRKINLFMLFGVLIFGFVMGLSFGVDADASSRKQQFTSRYNKLLRTCKKKFKYDGSMYDMRKDASDEYSLWDKELNYVYKNIYNSIGSSSKKALKKSQVSWIKKKERVAKSSADSGGTMDSLNYLASLEKQTKKRIKWLIKNYA